MFGRWANIVGALVSVLLLLVLALLLQGVLTDGR